MAYKAEVKKMLEGLPEKGHAEIRLRDPKRTGSITIRDYYNPETGEQKEFLSSTGNEKVIRLTKKKVYDFSKVDDRLEFYHIQGHPIFSKGGNAVLECVSLDEEAEWEVEDRDTFADAIVIIRNLKGEELRDFARIMLAGRRMPMNGRTSDTIVKKYLYDIADADPQRVIDEYDDDDKEYKILIRRGIESNVFAHTNGVYKFGQNIMGSSFETALLWLKENEDLIPSIRKDLA
jgi:hypothetical protein